MAYKLAIRAAGLAVREVPLRDWHIDVDATLAAITPQTRLIFIDNPGNPRSTFMPRDQLSRLLRGLPRDILVVIDEAYHEYAWLDGCPSALELRHLHPNLVVIRTFSKAHGLASLRIGFVVAPPPVIHALHVLRPPFNTSRVSQVAAVAAIEDVGHLSAIIEQNRILREEMESELLTRTECRAVDSSTNFLLILLGLAPSPPPRWPAPPRHHAAPPRRRRRPRPPPRRHPRRRPRGDPGVLGGAAGGQPDRGGGLRV